MKEQEAYALTFALLAAICFCALSLYLGGFPWFLGVMGMMFVVAAVIALAGLDGGSW